jgi:acetyl-CoA carboxylase biotin carboxyl carrier protein
MITARAEVTGSVWKITVEAGQHIELDEEIAILESMKMEIPVLAPTAGTVVEILVAPTEPVTEGQDLFRIDETSG